MTTEAAPETLLLTVQTVIADLRPGDIFAYGTRISLHDSAASPIASITRIHNAIFSPSHSPLFRILHERPGQGDALYFGAEIVYRADRP